MFPVRPLIHATLMNVLEKFRFFFMVSDNNPISLLLYGDDLTDKNIAKVFEKNRSCFN